MSLVFNPETWVAIASAFIAVCALGVTVWQGRQNYKHNKMSVRPKLSAMEDYDDNGATRLVTFKLINSGLGPAIIKDFILIYEGKEVSRNNHKIYDDFLREKTIAFSETNIVSFAPGASLLVNEQLEIFSFRHKREQDASFMDKLNLCVNYQSIYEDETFTYDTQKDRQFHGKEESGQSMPD